MSGTSPPPGPDFLVLTGFLGSGKTTLLRDFLARPDSADTAVIVNEVGEIGLDGAILRESSGDEVAMALLSNGCVCCAMGSDLASTVETLLAAERPHGAGPLRRIILETSGLSKPGPVLRQLASLALHRMRVRVLATYDAERGPESTVYAEAVAQWAGADIILVTKADRVPPARLAAAGDEARRLNPLAHIVAEPRRDELVDRAFGPATPVPFASTIDTAPEQPARHPHVSVLLARTSRVASYADLTAWLDNLAGALGERLLRLKGLVRIVEIERPLLVQSVGTVFSAPRPFPADESGSFLVIIARDAAATEIGIIEPDLSLVVTGGIETNPFAVRPRSRLVAERG